MLPRQAARRAADYLSFYFAGASDLNYADVNRLSPNALIMYYDLGGNLLQASYNNLTGAETNPGGANNAVLPASGLRPANTSTRFGDIGTDVITMVTPFDPARYQVFAPFPAFGANVDLWFNFRVGCNCVPPACIPANDTANLLAFRAATGDDGVTGSALLMLVDRNGAWSYVRIPNASYGGGAPPGSCNDVATFRNIHVGPVDTLSATLPAAPNPVGNLTDPVFLVTGLQVISFRVLTDDVDGLPKLQQKLGPFDPNTDNPGTDFTNVMENVEDLQVAYMYAQNAAAGANGLVWNTGYVDGLGVRHDQTIDSTGPGCGALPAPACDTHVPFQAGPNFGAAPPPLDITNVIGVRVSVTGRSPLLPLGAQKLTNIDVKESLLATASQHFRPASEDHAVTMDTVNPTWPQYDQFDHYRATATLMLRNRIPRG
jgi:hypothetical protein